jgi:hypothetical protein
MGLLPQLNSDVLTDHISFIGEHDMKIFTEVWRLLLMIAMIVWMHGEAITQTRQLSITETMQLGISTSGVNLVVSVKPSADALGGLSGFAVTIRWLNFYNINLGTISSPYPILKSRDELVAGSFESQMFVLSAPIQNLNWTAGTEYPLFSIPLSQSGSGTGTFELAPAGFKANGEGDPYVEFNLVNVTDNTHPYYAPSTDFPLPVELTSFTAKQDKQGIVLAWATATETNNAGFEVQRAVVASEKNWLALGFVDGSGTSNAPKEYTYRNRDIQTGKYLYRLKMVDRDGGYKYSQEIEAAVAAPKEFTMSQNYPNPFNPTTSVNFSLAEKSNVAIKLYDLTGREVRMILQEEREAGYYTIRLDGSALTSGIYLYRLTAASKSQVYTSAKKLLLLK